MKSFSRGPVLVLTKFAAKAAAKGAAFCAGIVLVTAIGSSPATAAQGDTAWKFMAADSEIEFVGTSLRAEFSGHFKTFEADIAFDPDTPEAGRIKVEIDTKSITTGLKEIDTLLSTSDWFASKKYPVVTFEASGFRKIEGDRYAIDGTVTVKGKTDKIKLEAEVEMAEDPDDPGMMKATAISEISLKRLAFLIGTGPWADTKVIADDVTLNVKLAARRQMPEDEPEPQDQKKPGGEPSDDFYLGLFSKGGDTEKGDDAEKDADTGEVKRREQAKEKTKQEDEDYWAKQEEEEDEEDGKGSWEKTADEESDEPYSGKMAKGKATEIEKPLPAKQKVEPKQKDGSFESYFGLLFGNDDKKENTN